MPRRTVLTPAQRDALFALPTREPDLIRHWTLGETDLAAVRQRRRPGNRLGFALQLCALRYPGRLLRPGEVIPAEAFRFVADQLGAVDDGHALYDRANTRYEQLDDLRAAFGFQVFAPGHRREVWAWLLPVAPATTSGAAVASALMDELRRRKVIAPGASVVERMVAAILVLAERHVAVQITRGLTPVQLDGLDGLLQPKEGTPMSVLAWARQPPGAPGHRGLARLVDQLACLRAVGLDPACAEGVHPERLRKLAREGGRFTAQHLRALTPLRRRATLVATVLDTAARLTDDGVALFDRAVGRMFRRAEAREEQAALRDARAVNDKVRLLAKLGTALIEAKEDGADLDGAVAMAVGWEKLAALVAEAKELVRPDKADLPALAARAWPVLHRLGPVFLDALQLRAVPAAAATLRAVEVLHGVYSGKAGRKWPKSLPTSFLRSAWRDAVLDSGDKGNTEHRRTWEAATLLALRDRLSDHTFALMHLLGFRFAPRIPNLPQRRLYAFGPPGTWPALEPFIAGKPDDKLVIAHWDDVLRVAASIRTGTVSASLMLRRLGAYPRQNGLALALREIGRVERTLYTLDWLEQPPLRRQATAELNKGELRNALARAVCFHRLGRLRDRTVEAQQHRASGLTLVTAAISLWNTVYLSRALDALRGDGEIVPDKLLPHLAPLGWQHVNLTGDYLWNAEGVVGPDGFRPLRGSAAPALKEIPARPMA